MNAPRYIVWVLGLGLLAAPLRGQAQPSDARANADLLYTQARELAAQGNYDLACPKFEASLRLDPALGTRLNLADCYEAQGKLASAWAMFRSAADAARLLRDAREKLANTRAERLLPRLPRLVIKVTGEAAPGLTIVRSGAAIEPAMLGAATYVDPGRIVVTAHAPGYAEFTTTFDAVEAKEIVVEIPALLPNGTGATVAPVPSEPAPESTAPKISGAGDPRPPVNPPLVQRERETHRNWRMLGLGVAAGGVAFLGTAGVVSVLAKAQYDDAFDRGACDRATAVCTAQGQADTENARTKATAATVIGGVGVVAVGVGVYLYVRHRKQPASQRAQWSPVVSPDAVGVAVHAAF